MRRFATGLRYALFTLVCTCALFAQRDLATITGTVTDSSGAIVPSAKVVITEQGTNQSYEITTNAAGEFTRPALKPSTYDITVTAPGFKKAEQRNVILNPGERTGVNITLTIGDIGQTVEIISTSLRLQTESTQVGAAINAKTLTDVPLGRPAQFRLSGAAFTRRGAGRSRRARRQ